MPARVTGPDDALCRADRGSDGSYIRTSHFLRAYSAICCNRACHTLTSWRRISELTRRPRRASPRLLIMVSTPRALFPCLECNHVQEQRHDPTPGADRLIAPRLHRSAL